MIGVVASTSERGLYEAEKRCLDLRRVYIFTPQNADYIRGCRLDDVIYTDGWWELATLEQVEYLHNVLMPALLS